MTNNSYTTEDSASNLTVLKINSGNDNFNIDLGKSNYVIRDIGGTDTLTFINTKKDNLEYSNKDGRAYIRDKKSQNVVTFDDVGYAERKKNVDKAYEAFNSTYQSIDMEKALEMESDTGVRLHDAQSGFHTMYNFYQKGRIPADLLSKSVGKVNNKFDDMISIANSRNDEKSSKLYTTIKKAFREYTSQLLKLDTNHKTVIEKIDINGNVYNANDLLVSTPLENPFTNPNKVIFDISDLTDITDIRILKDNYSDYTEQEVEDIQDELYSSDMMPEYMAGFKDLGQELGIQRVPAYYDFNPGHDIVPAN